MTDALGWVEFAMTFVFASLRYGSASRLTSLSRNIGGLESFISKVEKPGGVNSLVEL